MPRKKNANLFINFFFLLRKKLEEKWDKVRNEQWTAKSRVTRCDDIVTSSANKPTQYRLHFMAFTAGEAEKRFASSVWILT